MIPFSRVARRFSHLSPIWIHKFSSFSAHVAAKPKSIRALLESPKETKTQKIIAHARTVRSHRNIVFLGLNDGSLPGHNTLQAVIQGDLFQKMEQSGNLRRLAPGVAVEASGLVKQSKGRGQDFELQVSDLVITGDIDAASYPVVLGRNTAPAMHQQSGVTASSSDMLRRMAHLRPRDARHGAVLRVRDAVERRMDQFFNSQEFVRVVAPVITSSDCEGGGEVFRVQADRDAQGTGNPTSHSNFWSDSMAYLTVSAQLHLEAIALGLGKVYTMGPSFRAEGSATNRHLAEFWMCEAEQITSQNSRLALEEIMHTVEGLVRQAILAGIADQSMSEFLWLKDLAGLSDLRKVAESKDVWPRITYTEAIDMLSKVKTSFSVVPPTWGQPLASEHERWLSKDGPIFVTDYPSSIKPFYMSSEATTVACFDLLVPRIGELVGGSLRENRPEVLLDRMQEGHFAGTSESQEHHLAWYADLRKYGSNPHGGFGLGIERLLSWITNTENIRDVVTFPRVKGRLRY